MFKHNRKGLLEYIGLAPKSEFFVLCDCGILNKIQTLFPLLLLPALPHRDLGVCKKRKQFITKRLNQRPTAMVFSKEYYGRHTIKKIINLTK